MTLNRARVPLAIFGLIVLLIGFKTLFNPGSHPRVENDGTVYYKKSGAHDNYLYRINDTVAFQARIIPTMDAISIEVVSYKHVGGIQGFLLGKNREHKFLFSPSYMSGDWIHTTYAKPGEPFALNLKTGEFLKNPTTSDNLYETDYYKERFSSGTTLADRYVLKNYEYINTYKSSGADLVWAGLFLGALCLVWFIIALILDIVKPRKAKAVAAAPVSASGNRAPGA